MTDDPAVTTTTTTTVNPPDLDDNIQRRTRTAGLVAIPYTEDVWFKTYWRPAAAWVYLFICLFDFVLAPIAWAYFEYLTKDPTINQWLPLTIQGGAIFHLSFGAIIGISAWGRTKERISGVDQILGNKPE